MPISWLAFAVVAGYNMPNQTLALPAAPQRCFKPALGLHSEVGPSSGSDPECLVPRGNLSIRFEGDFPQVCIISLLQRPRGQNVLGLQANLVACAHTPAQVLTVLRQAVRPKSAPSHVRVSTLSRITVEPDPLNRSYTHPSMQY